jgi:hypothetical protein
MDLSRLRLRNQYIAGSRLEDPEDVVRALCAVQAQDYQAALWAIGLRLRRATEADVEQAIIERRIVRTWPLRGTLHFVSAKDVRWLLELLAPQTLRRSAARLRRDFEIDGSLMKRARKVVMAALKDGQALPRPTLYERLEAQGIETRRQRGLHVLWWLTQEGLICCGPRDGKQHTFVLLDDWVPAATALTRDAALAQLAARYFSHHGPATLADFAWWAGLSVRDASAAIDGARSGLSSESDGETTWWSKAGAKRRASAAAACHLLPVYDEFTVAYADRSAALDPRHAKKAAAGHGIFRAPILIDGRIVGSWTRTLKKSGVEIRLAPLIRLDREHLAAIHDAAERYGEFVGLPAKVVNR